MSIMKDSFTNRLSFEANASASVVACLVYVLRRFSPYFTHDREFCLSYPGVNLTQTINPQVLVYLLMC